MNDAESFVNFMSGNAAREQGGISDVTMDALEIAWREAKRERDAIRTIEMRDELLAGIKMLNNLRANADRFFYYMPPEEGKEDISHQKQKEATLNRWDKRIQEAQDMIKSFNLHIDFLGGK
jgi:hypothetical protein